MMNRKQTATIQMNTLDADFSDTPKRYKIVPRMIPGTMAIRTLTAMKGRHNSQSMPPTTPTTKAAILCFSKNGTEDRCRGQSILSVILLNRGSKCLLNTIRKYHKHSWNDLGSLSFAISDSVEGFSASFFSFGPAAQYKEIPKTIKMTAPE